MGTLVKRCSAGAAVVAVLLLAGCSQSTPPPASGGAAAANAPAGPPEMVTAKTAFWPTYKSAQAWSSDAEAMKIAPADVPGFKNDGGKAAMWQVTFGSPGKHQFRIFSYAIATVPPDIHKGVSAGLPMPWGGQTRDAMPIDLTVFNIDSDAAYKTAAAQAAVWIAKNPGKPPTSLELGSTYELHAPVWYVAWGNKKDGYIALVNAATGDLFKSRK